MSGNHICESREGEVEDQLVYVRLRCAEETDLGKRCV